MGNDKDAGSRKRKRRLRGALVILRRRMMKACNKFQSANDFYGEVKENLQPILAEYGDEMPSVARSSLDRVMSMADEGTADLDIACKACKGEVNTAIKGVAGRMGVEGAIREALRPVENLAPEWLVTSSVAQGLAAVGVVIVGGGLAAGIAMAASGGGAEEETVSASDPTGVVFEAETGPGAATAGAEAIDLPDPCALVTMLEAEQVLGGPVTFFTQLQGDQCVYVPTNPGREICEGINVVVSDNPYWQPQPSEVLVPGSNGELYAGDLYDRGHTGIVNIRRGRLLVLVSVESAPGACTTDGYERRQEEALGLARIALERIPEGVGES